MFKIDSAGSTGGHEFQDPTVGVSGTVVSADWLNSVQRELIAILTAAGITPDKADDDQIITAINQLIAAGGGGGGGSLFWRDAVATTGALAPTASAGTICLVLADLALYEYNGSAWVKYFKASDYLTTAASTDAVAEGSTNKYFTDERAQDAIGALVQDSSTIDVTYNDGSNSMSLVVIPGGIEVNTLAATTPLSLAKGGSGGATAQAGADTFGGQLAVAINSTQALLKNKIYYVDTTSGSVTLTLPALAGGGRIRIVDIAGKWGTNSVVVAPATGEKIQGLATNGTKTFSLPNGWAEFFGNGSTEWGVQTTIPGLLGSQVYGGYQSSQISTATTLVNGTWYLTNTTSAGFTGTLPPGTSGARVKISDDKETWDINPFVLAPATGETLGQLGANVTITCNIKRGWVELIHDGTTWVINSFASTSLNQGGGYTVAVVTSAVSPAVDNTLYAANTTSSAFSITLPTLVVGAKIKIQDALRTWGTNNLTIVPASGGKIYPFATNESVACNITGGWIELIGVTGGWSPTTLSTAVSGNSSGLVGVRATAAVPVAVSGVMYQADTTSGAFTITLPGGTSAAVIGVLDAGPFFTTNNLTVDPGASNSIDIDVNGGTLVFDGNRQSCIFYRANGSSVWEIQTASQTAYAPGFAPGYTGSTAISAGNIGEQTLTNSAGVAVTTSANYITLASKLLQPGIYLVSGVGALSIGTMTGLTQSYVGISLTTNAVDSASANNLVIIPYTTTPTNLVQYHATPTRYVFVPNGTTQTAYLVGRCNYTAVGSANWDTTSALQTVRIA